MAHNNTTENPTRIDGPADQLFTLRKHLENTGYWARLRQDENGTYYVETTASADNAAAVAFFYFELD